MKNTEHCIALPYHDQTFKQKKRLQTREEQRTKRQKVTSLVRKF